MDTINLLLGVLAVLCGLAGLGYWWWRWLISDVACWACESQTKVPFRPSDMSEKEAASHLDKILKIYPAQNKAQVYVRNSLTNIRTDEDEPPFWVFEIIPYKKRMNGVKFVFRLRHYVVLTTKYVRCCVMNADATTWPRQFDKRYSFDSGFFSARYIEIAAADGSGFLICPRIKTSSSGRSEFCQRVRDLLGEEDGKFGNYVPKPTPEPKPTPKPHIALKPVVMTYVDAFQEELRKMLTVHPAHRALSIKYHNVIEDPKSLFWVFVQDSDNIVYLHQNCPLHVYGEIHCIEAVPFIPASVVAHFKACFEADFEFERLPVIKVWRTNKNFWWIVPRSTTITYKELEDALNTAITSDIATTSTTPVPEPKAEEEEEEEEDYTNVLAPKTQ